MFSPEIMKLAAECEARLAPMFGLLGIDWGWGFDKINGSDQYGKSQFHFVLGQEL